MMRTLITLWRGDVFPCLREDTDDDIKEMIIWSSNIQDPSHELFQPFLLTN